MAAAGAQGRDRAFVIAMGVAQRVGRQFRVMQPGFGDVGHTLLSGMRRARRDRPPPTPPPLAGEGVRRASGGRVGARVRKALCIYGSAFLSGARVTTASMSAIALTIKRAVIG